MLLLKEQKDMDPVCAQAIKGFKSSVVLGGEDTRVLAQD